MLDFEKSQHFVIDKKLLSFFCFLIVNSSGKDKLTFQCRLDIFFNMCCRILELLLSKNHWTYLLIFYNLLLIKFIYLLTCFSFFWPTQYKNYSWMPKIIKGTVEWSWGKILSGNARKDNSMWTSGGASLSAGSPEPYSSPKLTVNRHTL